MGSKKEEAKQKIASYSQDNLDYVMLHTLLSLADPEIRADNRRQIAERNGREIESDEHAVATLSLLAKALGEEYAKRGKRVSLDELIAGVLENDKNDH